MGNVSRGSGHAVSALYLTIPRLGRFRVVAAMGRGDSVDGDGAMPSHAIPAWKVARQLSSSLKLYTHPLSRVCSMG